MGSNNTIAIIVMVFIQLMFFFVVQATADLNPASHFANPNGSLIMQYCTESGKGCVIDSERIKNDMPSSVGSSSPTTGIYFTDVFSSAKNWLLENTPGVKTAYSVLLAPYNVLQMMNLPAAFVFAIGSMWYALEFYFLISFMWGRE